MYERRTKRRFDVGGTSAAQPPPPAHDQYPWQGEHEDEPFLLFDHFDDTRKVAKSAACRNRAIGEAWDDYDSIFYNAWLKLPSRAATRSSALEDLSNISPSTHYRHSLLCQTCLHVLRETSSVS
ncbi:hypothetical protein F2Q69_00007041 [Brassica cretica]|uniref:Uncharacterized protein n=1 Tax=Brassica cretica TaxID=69181 RepID=A0A8S9P5Z5_BRACR|nr:hypothetical protein F2Q69_00007041 [Brassica cretica]